MKEKKMKEKRDLLAHQQRICLCCLWCICFVCATLNFIYKCQNFFPNQNTFLQFDQTLIWRSCLLLCNNYCYFYLFMPIKISKHCLNQIMYMSGLKNLEFECLKWIQTDCERSARVIEKEIERWTGRESVVSWIL